MVFSSSKQVMRTFTRVGVYAIIIRDSSILLTEKGKGGCYEGLFDLPGGGIEFGETPQETLCREVLEEVGMTFDSMLFFDNLSCAFDVPINKLKSLHMCEQNGQDELVGFHQIGLIYKVEGALQVQKGQDASFWHDIESLSLQSLTPFARKVVQHLQEMKNK